MKKLLFFIILFGTLSCTKNDISKKPVKQDLKTIFVIDGFSSKTLRIIVIDSCEYLYGDWLQEVVLTHKGDCNNIKHNQNGK